MSGISIGRFVQIARQAEDGDIRMNSGSERRLVNKGTLENRLGTLVNMGDEGTRGHRTETALEKFREALSDRYGEDIAEKALGEAFQLNERDIKDGLNGYVVIEAARQAKELAINNQLTNRKILEDRKLDSGHEDVDDAFNQRFKQSLEARSLFFEQELFDFEVHDLEEEIKTQVCGLKDKDRLDQSIEARQALSDALQGVLVAIANRQPPNVLLEKLMEVEELQKALAEIEKGFEGPKDALKVCTVDALRKLIREYGGQFIGDLQKRSFSDSSSLRAIYTSVKQVAENDDSSEAQRKLARALMEQCEQLVRIFSAATTPHSETRGDDLKSFLEESVDQKQLQSARFSLNPAFDQRAGNTEHCQDFLHSIGENFGQLVEDKDGLAIHAWDDPEVGKSLERYLGFHMDDGVSREEAFRNYRLGIERDRSLHPGLRDKLLAGLDLLQAEHDLVEAMQTNPKFRDFPREQLWQLVVPGNHTDVRGKWDLEHKVQGSYAGLCRGLTEVMKTRPNQVFTGDRLGQLHETVTRDNIRQDDLRYLYGEGTLRAQMDKAREENRVPVGYREGTIQQELRLDDGSLTEDGRDQFVDHMDKNYQWFGASAHTDSTIRLQMPWHNDPGPCRSRGDRILYDFQQKLVLGSSEDVRLDLVADTIQQLYRSHLFEDGNTETVVGLMTNQLLLSAGLSPAILDDPDKAMGCSRDELVAKIRGGQERFILLKNNV